MTRRAQPRLLLAVLTVAAMGREATAQTRSPLDEAWEAWTQKALDKLREGFAMEARAARATTTEQRRTGRKERYTAVREPALDRESAASSLETLTLALKTDVGEANNNSDVEAGLSVAPSILSGSGSRPSRAIDGLSFIIATVKGGKTRAGAKFAWTSLKVPESLPDLSLPPCTFDEPKVQRNLTQLKSHFAEACSVLSAYFVQEPGDGDQRALWNDARAACGLQGARPATLTQARAALTTALRGSAQGADAAQLRALNLVAPSLALLDPETNRLPLATACYSPKELGVALQRELWAKTKTSVGVLTTVDWFQRKTGFNPDDPKPLPQGEKAAWLVQAGASVEKGRYAATLALGWAKARADFGEDPFASVRPSFSVTAVVSRLDGQPLIVGDRDHRVLNPKEDGTVPPLLVAGVLAKLDYAKTRPDVQQSKWNSIEIQAFLDFRVNDKLSFRLGVPYRGTLVTRAANKDAKPPTLELRKLQWSLPVFVATVVKL